MPWAPAHRCRAPRARGLDHLGQPAAARGLLVGPGPERGATGRSSGLSRRPTKTSTPTRWPPWPGWRRRGGAARHPEPPRSGGGAWPRSRSPGRRLADGHVAAPQRRRCVAQRGPGPHGGDQLGLVVAAPRRISSPRVAPPTMPSTGSPALRWNSARARTVASPKMPSTRPVSNPSVHRRCCRSATSSPRASGSAGTGSGRREEAGLDQGVPGLGPADAVDPEAAQALEGLEGGPGAGPEDAVGVDGRAGHESGQAVLDVGDGFTAVPDGERQAYR